MGRATGWLIVGASASIWLGVFQPWHWYIGDLIVYRGGGHALVNGDPLYSVVSGRNHLHFTYPPFAAIPAAALAQMPLALAKVVISIASAAGLVGCIATYARRVAAESAPLPTLVPFAVLAGAIWLEPVRATLSFGQVDIVLMTLVIVDLLLLADRRASGALVGLAAAIKLTPAAFVVYLFATGRIRQGRNAVMSFAGFTLLGALVAPTASRTYWLEGHFFDARRVGRVENASNQSLHGVLARLLRTANVPAWWLLVAVAVLAAGCWLAVLAHRRGRESQAVLVMAIAMLCASPISWSHHWVWCAIMPIACYDVVRRSESRAAAVLAVAVLLPFALGLVFWAPHTAHRELLDSLLQQLVSATYVLAGVLLCALIALDPATPSRRGAAG